MSKKIAVKKMHIAGNIAGWVVFCLFLLFVLKQVRDSQVDSHRFILKEVKINFDDGKIIEGSDAFKYLGLKENYSIFKINPKILHEKVLKLHPEILEMSIYKKIPSLLDIGIKNRETIAQISLDRYYPLDVKGFILPFPSNFRIKGFANIIGVNPVEVKVGGENSNPKIILALNILDLVKKILSYDYTRMDIDVSDPNNVIFFIPNGPSVRLGGNGFQEKFARLKLVLEDMKTKSLNPGTIDLRFENAVLIPPNVKR